MDCHEARNRLTGSRISGDTGADRELRDHLRHCRTCAAEAIAAGALSTLFESGREPDDVNVRPLADTRRNIEAAIAARGGRRAVARSHGHHPWRPVFAGLATVAAVLVLALVPFGFNSTIGYELAVGGVEPDLARDDDRLCDAFYYLGLNEAAVDLQGCDSTCKLRVFDLKTEEEVHLAVSVLRNLNRSDLTVDVIPVQTRLSQTILGRASDRLL